MIQLFVYDVEQKFYPHELDYSLEIEFFNYLDLLREGCDSFGIRIWTTLLKGEYKLV